jgi:histidinol-phosphatase
MFEDELRFAHAVADDAAVLGMGSFRAPGLEVRHKADASLVTEADLAIEAMVRERIAAAFPGDRVLGEEEGGSHDPAGRVWIVDPIDATANFARGIPVWGTLLALQIDGEGVLGIASAPALGERYAAVRGMGATVDGAPARVSEVSSLGEAQVLFAELRDMAPALREAVLETVDRAWRDRSFGDFWAHMLVARGAAEVMIEPDLAIWDFAALQVIVEEAGGRMTTFLGGPPVHGGSILTTNGALHEELLGRLAGTSA